MHTGFGYRATHLPPDAARKTAMFELLEQVCISLELTETQQAKAKEAYQAVGAWLVAAEAEGLRLAEVSAHGSVALRTTVKPIGSNEHDVDSMCLLRGITPDTPPALVKLMVGQRLREHGRYAAMLEEKTRCWRLNYANEFHLDLTPSIRNPRCPNGGELVPDKKLARWKPTNPKAYRGKFEERSLLMPQGLILKAQAGILADVEEFPEQKGRKALLQRIVQLLKRHRDVWFDKNDPDLAVISIIITTLASQSYEACVRQFSFDNPLDLLLRVISMMPHFIEREWNGTPGYFVMNETTTGENFADKWNLDPKLAHAFYRWNKIAAADFGRLADLDGLDEIAIGLSAFMGEAPVRKAMSAAVNRVGGARTNGSLAVGRQVGLTTTARAAVAPVLPVLKHTNFGRAKDE